MSLVDFLTFFTEIPTARAANRPLRVCVCVCKSPPRPCAIGTDETETRRRENDET